MTTYAPRRGLGIQFRAVFRPQRGGCLRCRYRRGRGLHIPGGCRLRARSAIGDFDSLGYVPEGVEVLVFPPEKDASDMELALGEAVARGADAVEVYGRSAAGSIIHWRICNFSPLSPSTA